jgi:hypothetical protein
MNRTTALLILTVAGCGTSDPLTWSKCPGCAEAGATWDLIADGAEVNGTYDPVGPPDPYLCVTVKGKTECSTSKSDTSSPRWSEAILHSVPTTDLTAGLEVGLWDQDTGGLDTNDFICSTQVGVTDADLDAGGIRFSCSNGTTAELQFERSN